MRIRYRSRVILASPTHRIYDKSFAPSGAGMLSHGSAPQWSGETAVAAAEEIKRRWGSRRHCRSGILGGLIIMIVALAASVQTKRQK